MSTWHFKRKSWNEQFVTRDRNKLFASRFSSEKHCWHNVDSTETVSWVTIGGTGCRTHSRTLKLAYHMSPQPVWCLSLSSVMVRCVESLGVLAATTATNKQTNKNANSGLLNFPRKSAVYFKARSLLASFYLSSSIRRVNHVFIGLILFSYYLIYIYISFND